MKTSEKIRPLTEYLVETNDYNGGVQKVYSFDNSYGASVVRHEGSYGFKAGLWEIAVLDSQGELDYSTPVTSDVIGHLTWKQVSLHLREIQKL